MPKLANLTVSEDQMYAAGYLYKLLFIDKTVQNRYLRESFEQLLNAAILDYPHFYGQHVKPIKKILQEKLDDLLPESSKKDEQAAKSITALITLINDLEQGKSVAQDFFKEFGNAQHYQDMQNQFSQDLGRWEHGPKHEVQMDNYQFKQEKQLGSIFDGLKKQIADIDNGFRKAGFREKLTPVEQEDLDYINMKMNDFLDKEKYPETTDKLKALPQVIRKYGSDITDFSRNYQKKYQQPCEPGQSALAKLVNWFKGIFQKKQLPNPVVEAKMNESMNKVREGLTKVSAGIKELAKVQEPKRTGPKPG